MTRNRINRADRNKKVKRFPGFSLIPKSSGIILDSIWIKDDASEIIVVSAFGGRWHFKPLEEDVEGTNPSLPTGKK